MKTRLDQILVERGLADSREKARALILAGSVLVEGQKSDKPGHAFPEHCRIDVAERLPYVSRGGLKLAGALDHFGIDVRGRVCLDVGASTGGFTDCLLQRGAARVYAIDVGHGQLDWKIRSDPRVIVQEGINARYLRADDFIREPAQDRRGPTSGQEPTGIPPRQAPLCGQNHREPAQGRRGPTSGQEPTGILPRQAPLCGQNHQFFDLAVCDASFISATLLIPAFAPLLSERGELIILVKPQFEVGKDQVGKGGIVRDPALHQTACDRVRVSVESLGFTTAIMESPILGAEGNREFLLYARH